MLSSLLFSDCQVPPRRPASSVMPAPALLGRFADIPKLAGVTAASRLQVRSAPEMAATGIPALDSLVGGLPRGCLSEICGPASSGRTSVLLSVLATATQRGEFCALIDTSDAFHPDSAAAAAADFARLLWVRCGQNNQKKSANPKTSALEQALRVLDLLLQAGGFGVVAIDLSDVPFPLARRVPLASWFRFQRALEPTSTVLLVMAQAPCAQTCASLAVRLQARRNLPGSRTIPSHAQFFKGMQIEGELLRSRLTRKPAQSDGASFRTQAVRAG